MTDDVIGTIALMLGVGLAARVIADLVRLPAMIFMLAAGALVGPAALGWIDVPLETPAAQTLLTLGVSFILFHGGLQLSVRVLERTAITLLLLATAGLLITATVTGVVAAAAFDVPLLTGLLIGAVLAPSDPAILIPLFDRLSVRPKLAQTIVAESALNDPTGAVLVLALAGAILGGGTSVSAPLVDFVVDVAISTALGVAFGIALAFVISTRRGGIWRESASIAVAAVVAASFVSIDFAGGSGYLGAFLAGLIVGNMDELRLAMRSDHDAELRVVMHAVSDVVVLLVFVLLGANIPFGLLGDYLLPALVVVAVFALVARPLTVLACTAGDRRAGWTRGETVFLSWTRETGVVPAALAGILVALEVPDADLVTITVAVAVIATLLVQSTTKPWLAGRLGLLEPPGTSAADPES